MNRAVFIDRDGTIIENLRYVYRLEDYRPIPNAIKGLKLLKHYKLFIVTNQSGIGRGIYTLKDMHKFNKFLLGDLKKQNINIKKIYYCPHSPEENCWCRKPKTKMLEDAQREFKIDLTKSFVVGDMKADIELGKNAGCRTILVLTGNETNIKDEVNPDYTAKDLLDAAKWILKNSK